jgi:hypothetical protein
VWASAVGVVTRLWAGWPGFDAWQDRIFSLRQHLDQFWCHCRLPSIDTGVLSLHLKCLGCVGNHLPPYNAEVKKMWSYSSTPTNVCIA